MTPGMLVIGGSAGSLEPLMAILATLPPDFTWPIGVVVHMLPTQPSHLSSLLSRQGIRRVCEPEDKQPLESSTIYVAPPNYHMLIERTRAIALSVDEPVNFSRPSIDVLFESAATAFGHRTIGILLSGSNNDGAAGLKRIAAGGGIALVQKPESAAYAVMPQAALHALPTASAYDASEMATAVISKLKETIA
jgi:two-component system chemotaxis response regulator CheB